MLENIKVPQLSWPFYFCDIIWNKAYLFLMQYPENYYYRNNKDYLSLSRYNLSF